jgi:hypothetical protein
MNENMLSIVVGNCGTMSYLPKEEQAPGPSMAVAVYFVAGGGQWN